MSFSLIIPHYNIPNLLIRCLNSIPKRSDLQIIVIDDNSTPESKEQLHLLEKAYHHVQFIYSEPGKGGGAVRNIGLDAAIGDFVFFADADDYFTPCLNQVLDDVKKTEADIFFYNAISVDTDTYSYAYRCWHVNRWINMSKTNSSKAEFDLRFAFGEPWCKIIKRSVITDNNIRFEETRIHNDTRFSYLVGYYAKTAHIDKRALYCVTDRTGSVSKILTPERLIARAKVFANANKFFKEHKIRRFDERAIRPLVKFILKLDIESYKSCKNVLKESGMSSLAIYIKLFEYPFYAIHKAIISASQYKVRLFG